MAHSVSKTDKYHIDVNKKICGIEIMKRLDSKAGYNYSKEKPMDGISYNDIRKKYLATIDGKQKYGNKSTELCEAKKGEIITKLGRKYKHIILVDDIEIYKMYSEIISFKFGDIELFDVKHILPYIYLGERSIRYKQHMLHKDNLYLSCNKNEFGGYQMRKLVNLETIKKILNCSNKINARKLAKMIGINVCDIFLSTKEQTHIGMIGDIFIDETMTDQFSIGKYRIDLYFADYKLAIECDENGHYSRNKEYEKKRQEYIESNGISFIRFNPDDTEFNICRVIGDIHMFITKYMSDKRMIKK